MWYLLFEIISAEVDFLTLQNKERLGLNIYIEQMTYAVGSLILKYIVLMHSCPTAYVIGHFNRAINFSQNGLGLPNYEIHLKISVNAPAMFNCWLKQENVFTS